MVSDDELSCCPTGLAAGGQPQGNGSERRICSRQQPRCELLLHHPLDSVIALTDNAHAKFASYTYDSCGVTIAPKAYAVQTGKL